MRRRTLEVMDAHGRYPERGGQRAAEGGADEQRPGKSRSFRVRHRAEVPGLAPRAREDLPGERHQPAHVVP